MFEVLLLVILLVHLQLEYRIWIAREEDIFTKYRHEGTPALTAAKWAYWCKAVWLVLLIALQYFGVEFQAALLFSFTVYAVLLQLVLPFRIYNLLNLVLALASLVWWWFRSHG